MLQYKNVFISSGGLPDWPNSVNWRALGRVLKIAPGGRTIVVKRLEDRQTFQEREEAEANGLRLAKEWVDWTEETRAWFQIWRQCVGYE